MSSAEITRRRLTSLKALTEELKDRTKNAPLELSHIKELLSNTRQLHTSRAHQPPAPDSSAPLPDSILSQKLPSNQEEALREEVAQLREENVGLERKLIELREEVRKVEEERRRLQAGIEKGNTHCFKLIDTLQGFVGRLSVPAQHYDRIEYSSYDIQLHLDRIVLVRREKGVSQEFDLCGLRGAEYCGTNVMVLRFQEFLQGQPLTSVFLKFVSEQHLKKWDLALYANYHIVTSLDQNKLFQRYFRCLSLDQKVKEQAQRIKAIRQSGQLDQAKEKDLLKMLIQKRDEYLEVKQLIALKLDHKIKARVSLNKEEQELIAEDRKPLREGDFNLEQADQRPKLDAAQKQNQNLTSPIERIAELDPHQEESQKILQPLTLIVNNPVIQSRSQRPFQIKHTDSNVLDPSFEPTSFRGSRASNLPSYSAVVQQPGNFPLSPPPYVAPHSQLHDSKATISNQPQQLRESKATLVNQLSIPEGRGQSFLERPTQIFDSTSRLNSSKLKEASQQEINNARMKLQNGYFATKYSKDGFSPHDKKVFLSLDCRKLCWSERDKYSQYKSVPLAVLISVEYGVVGEGVAKHLKNPDSRYFCVINYYSSDYKKKTIELGSGNMQDIKDLSSQLSIIIQNRQALPS